MTGNNEDCDELERETLRNLVEAHSDGDITIRQIATLTGLSSEDVYNIVESVCDTHNLGDNTGPTTFTPTDCPQNRVSDEIAAGNECWYCEEPLLDGERVPVSVEGLLLAHDSCRPTHDGDSTKGQ